MKKLLTLALAAVMCVGLLAGCTSSGPASEAAPASSGADSQAAAEPAGDGGENVVKIGVFEPVTGENGGGGFQEVLGIRYANQLFPTVDIGGTEYTQKEVADLMGISQSYISRLEKRIMLRLRREISRQICS